MYGKSFARLLFKMLLISGTIGGSYRGTWHWIIPVWVSIVIRTCSALKHGCKMATLRTAGDPWTKPTKQKQYSINPTLTSRKTYIRRFWSALAALVVYHPTDYEFAYKLYELANVPLIALHFLWLGLLFRIPKIINN